MIDPAFWRGRRVFITGHTGFMGGWLSSLLLELGADVTGFALEPPTSPSFYDATGLRSRMTHSVHGDVRDLANLTNALEATEASVVFHLAAQPLVRKANAEPHLTFETNVMGTVNILEAVRACGTVQSVLVVTTDKVYRNENRAEPYLENDRLGGAEPYSASKAASEHVLDGYREVYFGTYRQSGPEIGLAALRAGNVIGGGDWAENRLLPDMARAFSEGRSVVLRNPHSTRPWQHVLDPLVGYLMLAENLANEPKHFSGGWNFGPAIADCVAVGAFAEGVSDTWGGGAEIRIEADDTVYEERLLALDSTKAETEIGWRPRWALPAAIANTVTWYQTYYADGDMAELTARQIRDITGFQVRHAEFV